MGARIHLSKGSYVHCTPAVNSIPFRSFYLILLKNTMYGYIELGFSFDDPGAIDITRLPSERIFRIQFDDDPWEFPFDSKTEPKVMVELLFWEEDGEVILELTDTPQWCMKFFPTRGSRVL